LDGLALPNNAEEMGPRPKIFLELADLLSETQDLQSATHSCQEVIVIKRLGQVVESTSLHRRNGRLDRAVRRHEDHERTDP
jgi:hypothetical protein